MSAIPSPQHSAYLAGMPGDALSNGLWNHYESLLESGTPSDRILVWLEGTTRSRWTRLLKGEVDPHIAPEARPEAIEKGLLTATSAQRAYTPAAFIKEELKLWWPWVDAQLEAMGFSSCGPGKSPLRFSEPHFVAIDLAQYLINRFTAPLRTHEASSLQESTTPVHLQNIQLLDALSRGVENGHGLLDAQSDLLPAKRLASAIAVRLHAGSGSTEAALPTFNAIAACLEAYIQHMLEHRLLDYGLQLEVYASLLFKHPTYQEALMDGTSHLLVERLDEMPPRLQEMVRTFSERSVCVFATLQADTGRLGPIHGGLRAYVGADPLGAWELTRAWQAHALDPRPVSPLVELGRALHDGIVSQNAGKPLALGEPMLRRIDRYAFEEMLDALAEDLFARFDAGVEREEVALVAPSIDAFMIWGLQSRLAERQIPLYVFAGTNRLIQSRPVRVLMTLAKLCHPEWKLPPGRYEWIELLELSTGLNPLQLGRLADTLATESGLAHPDQLSLLPEPLSPEARLAYRGLFEWVERLRTSDSRPELPGLLRAAFAERYIPSRMKQALNPSEEEALQREISQMGQLIELCEAYQALLARIGPTSRDPLEAVAGRDGWEWSFLRFLHAGTIAERPFFRREPHRMSVMLASASQLAEKGVHDHERPLRHLYVLDFGSPRWLKRDRKELSNPRVLAHRWDQGRYGIDDEERDAAEKLAKTLWTLCWLPTESLRIFGCMTDAEGREQTGELPWLLESIVGRAASPGGPS